MRRLSTLLILGLLSLPAACAAGSIQLLAHDDAGTGRDAPSTLDPAFLVATGVLHSGDLVAEHLTFGAYPRMEFDGYDTYAFHAEAGQPIDVALRVLTDAAAQILDPQGVPLASDLSAGSVQWAGLSAVAPETGTYYLHLLGPVASPYCFRITTDGTDAAYGIVPLHEKCR